MARFLAYWPRRARSNERGGTTVEFALVFPVLCVLLIGSLDAGRMVVTRCMLSYSVTVGARAGIARNTAAASAVQSAVVAAAPMLRLTASNVNVYVNGVAATTASWSARTSGDVIKVSVNNYAFQPVSGSFAKLTSKSFSATGSQTVP